MGLIKFLLGSDGRTSLRKLNKIADSVEALEDKYAPMTDDEIADYVATGEPMDKAGAYGIQGRCLRYIDGIDGDYFNVVGLPLRRLKLLLGDAFGIDLESLAAAD